MNKQEELPIALRLADWLDVNSSGVYRPAAEAAAELRRLQNALEMAVSDAQRSWRELAAAEARNATLTDDAARYRFLRNWTRGVRSVEFGCADFAFPKIRVAAGVNVMRGAVCQHLDTAIDAELARAAASISTKGDGHG